MTGRSDFSRRAKAFPLAFPRKVLSVSSKKYSIPSREGVLRSCPSKIEESSVTLCSFSVAINKSIQAILMKTAACVHLGDSHSRDFLTLGFEEFFPEVEDPRVDGSLRNIQNLRYFMV